MQVLLVSQCNKQALVETRRILDQFAERKGARTWQTAITLQGLNTLRKMLRKTARKNTAVACHWIKTGNRTELLWIVGNMKRFNDTGTVPTNTTRRNILRAQDENLWHTLEDIALLSGLAGLFHDFGKANNLFQKKLLGKWKAFEPFRHEWLSLRFFQSFVGELSDRQWLEKLLNAKTINHDELLGKVYRDGVEKTRNPFKEFRPLARIIGWLILAHHRMPHWPNKGDYGGPPRPQKINKWIESNKFGPIWNSTQLQDREWSEKDISENWQCDNGLPCNSLNWQVKASEIARRALLRPALVGGDKDWLTDTFSMQLSRMVLMLADHYYSSHDATPKWQDKQYTAFANTCRETKRVKQQLDEHLIGVSHNAVLIAKGLPRLQQSLPAISRHKGFKKRSKDPRFRWQDKAYDLSCVLRDRSVKQGFFGINMASTGCGKTLANGRIMYGLANERTGCRFSVAMGLRTLTLQTGDALRSRLHLQEDDLAVLIGSTAVRRLHEQNQDSAPGSGSESDEELLSEDLYVHYEGTLFDGRLRKWLEQSPRIHRMVSAPILVSTIDHLMPATESQRGGGQIGPMLRLLSSDLVLDEPDDFDLSDLPALCRLVHWAGMLGSRVLVSSATLPPSLLEALYEAYLVGRRAYQRDCGDPQAKELPVCCAWFDEYRAESGEFGDREGFAERHEQFVARRIKELQKMKPLRKAKVLSLGHDILEPHDAAAVIAESVHSSIFQLHHEFGQDNPENARKVSIGLVRMANIRPLVGVARQLFSMQSPENHRIHFCVYHGQQPLAIRSAQEKRLDGLLDRHEPASLWQHPEIKRTLTKCKEDNQTFVVLATSVAEVGRDHDYDWAIAEPSSMRSLIQLAGRIQRHRKKSPHIPNLLVLSRNFKALIGEHIAYHNPGFESEDFPLKSHEIYDLLEEEQLKIISAIPRIARGMRLNASGNLVDLEHAHLEARLFGNRDDVWPNHASLWWNHNAHWCYELQRRSPFRQSRPMTDYILYMEEVEDIPQFNKFDQQGGMVPCDNEFEKIDLQLANGVSIWGNNDPSLILQDLAESFDMELGLACVQFGVVSLPTNQRWQYHPALGVHNILE